MSVDVVTLSLAKKYADKLALNGVAVKYPQINQATKRWEVFDSLSNSYKDSGVVSEGKDGITPHIDPASKHWFIGDADTGINAEGSGDIQSMSNMDIQNILNNL